MVDASNGVKKFPVSIFLRMISLKLKSKKKVQVDLNLFVCDEPLITFS